MALVIFSRGGGSVFRYILCSIHLLFTVVYMILLIMQDKLITYSNYAGINITQWA